MRKHLFLLATAAVMLFSTAQADVLQPSPSLQIGHGLLSSEFTCKITYDHIEDGYDYVEDDDSEDCLGKKYDRDSYYPPFWGGDAEMKWVYDGKLVTELRIKGAAATDSDDLLIGVNPDWDSRIEISLTETYSVSVAADDGVDWRLDIDQGLEGYYILQNEMGPEVGDQDDGAVWADNFQVALWENPGGTGLPDGTALPNYTFNPAVDVKYYSEDVTPKLVCPNLLDPFNCHYENWKKVKRFQAGRANSISGTGSKILRLQVSFSLGAFSNHGCSSILCNSWMGGEESAVLMGISDVIPHVKPDYPTASGVGGGHKNPVTADNGTGLVGGGWNITFILNDITPPNNPPVADDDSYNAIEDTALVVPATGVLIGDTDADSDPLTVVKDSGPANGSLTLNGNGSFSYTPNANYCGADSFTYHANDGTADSNIATVSLSVACVNDVPSFTKGANQAVLEDAAAQSVANWATNLSAGPANESTQTLSFNVSNNNNTLFSAQPSVSATGTLTYTPAADANGSATVTVAIKDSGGGTDTSASQTFNIAVTAVNDQPSFTHGGNQSVPEDSGTQTEAGFAVSSPGGGTNEAEQSFTYNVSNDNNALFSSQPAIDVNGQLTYQSIPNGNGSAMVTVSVTDSGGTDNGGVDTSLEQTFEIEVTAVNDPPVVTVVSPALQTSDYSDYIGAVSITVTDIDSTDVELALFSGEPTGLASNSVISKYTDSVTYCTESPIPLVGLNSTCHFRYSGQVLDPGLKIHPIIFQANDGAGEYNLSAGSSPHTLTVHAEDATVQLNNGNEVAIEVVAPDSDASLPFSLYFTAWETNDTGSPQLDKADFRHTGSAAYGDFTEAMGFMTLAPVGPGGPITTSCSKDDSGGTGYGEWTYFKCDFTGIPVNTYEVLAEVDGSSDTTVYYAGMDEDAFVVYDPSLGFTTAGGWFYWPGSEITEGHCSGYPGDKTNLGYTMKYNKKATKVQGSALLQRHTIDPATCLDAGSYRVKSNALYGLSIGDGTIPDDYGWAAFAGKATYRVPNGENEGNHLFFIYAEDHDEQGCDQGPSDRIWIEVWDKDDLTVMQLNGPDGDKDAEDIMCGNVYVPHKPKGKP